MLILLERHSSLSRATLRHQAASLSGQCVLEIVRMSLDPLKPSNHRLCSAISCWELFVFSLQGIHLPYETESLSPWLSQCVHLLPYSEFLSHLWSPLIPDYVATCTFGVIAGMQRAHIAGYLDDFYTINRFVSVCLHIFRFVAIERRSYVDRRRNDIANGFAVEGKFRILV